VPPYTPRQTVVGNEITSEWFSSPEEQSVRRTPFRGGIGPEAKATGKAGGYADGATMGSRVEVPRSGSIMSTPSPMGVQEWRDIDWPKVEADVHTLQRRIYRASHKGDETLSTWRKVSVTRMNPLRSRVRGKLSRTVLKTSTSGDRRAEFI
jgi:hypothetical protein